MITGNSIKFLLNYLLHTPARTYDSVLERLLKFCGDEQKSHSSRQLSEVREVLHQLCGNCEGVAGKILNLHLELEKLQMRIVDEVGSVRETILRSSGWLGGTTCSDDGSSAFDNFSRKFLFGDGSDGTAKAKATFDVLKAFQAAISETAKNHVQVPLVYLERCSMFKSSRLRSSTSIKTFISNIVKAEPDPLYEPEDADEDDDYTDPFEWAIPETAMDDLKTEDVDIKYDISDKSREPPGKVKQPKIRKEGQLPKGRKMKIKMTTAITTTIPKLERIRKNYFCQSCNYVSGNISRFEHHLRDHEKASDKKKEFSCVICSQEFSTRQYYIIHHARHRGAYRLKCDVCQLFVDGFELATHLEGHPEVVGKPISCAYCSNYSSTMKKHLDHLGNHGSAWEEIRCNICGQGPFYTKRNYLEHVDQKHEAVEKFKCDFDGCGKSFFNQDALNSHKIYHTGQFVCWECSRPFSSKSNLEVHMRLHTKETPIKCEHEGCSESFQFIQGLQAHIVREHGGVNKLKCELCGKEYGSKAGLQFHMVMSHDRGGQLCPVCNKKFATTFKLKVHMTNNHSDERPYICEECGKGYKTYDLCLTHKRNHSEKTFRCPQCPKAFALKKYLRDHLLVHARETSLVCDTCQKVFAHPAGLASHKIRCGSQLSKRNNDPSGKFICDGQIMSKLSQKLCGKLFGTLRRCKTHKRLHREKTFKCPSCPKAFSMNKYLIQHVRIHTGEKPFQCDGCGKAFNQDYSLKAHRKRCQL